MPRQKHTVDSRGVRVGLAIFVVGLAIGVAAVIYGGVVAEWAIHLLLAVLIGTMLSVLGTFVVVLMCRKHITQAIFGSDSTSIKDAVDAIREAIKCKESGEDEKASEAKLQAARILLAWYAWSRTLTWMVGVAFGLLAALAGVAGATLIVKQNEIMSKQIGIEERAQESARASVAFDLLNRWDGLHTLEYWRSMDTLKAAASDLNALPADVLAQSRFGEGAVVEHDRVVALLKKHGASPEHLSEIRVHIIRTLNLYEAVCYAANEEVTELSIIQENFEPAMLARYRQLAWYMRLVNPKKKPYWPNLAERFDAGD